MLPTKLNIALTPSSGGTATTINPAIYTPPPITLYNGQPKAVADPIITPNNVPAVILDAPINPTLSEQPVLAPTVGIPSVSGNILPTETYHSQNAPNFVPYWMTTGNGGPAVSSFSTLITSTISADQISTSSLLLDGQILTANPTAILLNGTVLPNTSTLSTAINSWSQYPAISTVNINNNNIIGANNLQTITLTLDNQALTANPTELLLNGVPLVSVSSLSTSINSWSQYPAISNVNINNCNINNVNNITTNILTLTGQTLTASPTQLTLNGTPLASISSLSTSISEWSKYAAISTLNMNNNNIDNVNTINALNVNTDKALIKQGVFSSIDAYDITTDYLTVNSTTINLFEFSTVFAEANVANVDTLTVNTINGQSYPPPAPALTLANVLSNGNVASNDINMNDFDLRSVNDITMSGFAPTITATNILGNMTLSALGTFNALTGGQMTLASGGILSLGGASYTTLENLKINNSVITKDGSVADLTFDNVASISNTTSGASLGLGANTNVDITAGTAVNVYKSGGALLQMGTSASDTNKLALSYNSGTSELSFNKNLVGTAGNSITLTGTGPTTYNFTLNNGSAQIGGRLDVNGNTGGIGLRVGNGALDMNSFNMSNVGVLNAANANFTNAPVLAQPAGYFTNANQLVNKAYADSLVITPAGQISTFSTLVASTFFANIAAFSTASISSLTASNTTCINAPILAQPAGYFTNANQLVNKAYADSLVITPGSQISTFSTLVASTMVANIAAFSTASISSLTTSNTTCINAPVLAQPVSYFTSVNQLVNKGYADSIISTSRNAVFSTMTASTITGNSGSFSTMGISSLIAANTSITNGTFSTMGISTLTATNETITNATFINAPTLTQPASYFTTGSQLVNKGYADSIISTSRTAIFSTVTTSSIIGNVGTFSTMNLSMLNSIDATFINAPLLDRPATYFSDPRQLVNYLYVNTLFMGGAGIQATSPSATSQTLDYFIGNTKWRAHLYLTPGGSSFTITNPGTTAQTIDIMVLSGGGSGGNTANSVIYCGGGGAGAQLQLYDIPVYQSASYPQTWTVFVGAGGAAQTSAGAAGNAGGSSGVILPSDQTPFGFGYNLQLVGGYGGNGSAATGSAPPGQANNYRSKAGDITANTLAIGCGGGGASGTGAPTGATGGRNFFFYYNNGPLGENGFAGGYGGGTGATGGFGAGGGGIRTVGGAGGTGSPQGAGGQGIVVNFWGSNVKIGGGGAGGRASADTSVGDVGFNFGGGRGEVVGVSLATDGAANSGGGGGGASTPGNPSGAGGSGLVCIRYRL